MAERETHNLEVAGSSPASPTRARVSKSSISREESEQDTLERTPRCGPQRDPGRTGATQPHACPSDTWKLKRTKQCAKCPWRVDVDPQDIPNGYSEEKHRGLADTIAREGDLSALFSGQLRVMACHETHDAHCVGWLAHQLGPGNNLALRLHVLKCANIGELKLVGEQHETFEDTLP